MEARIAARRNRAIGGGLLLAFALAFLLAMSMVGTAEAASAKAPYAGYKSGGQVYDAAELSMSTYDGRKVKKGYTNFTVWTGDSKAWNDKGQYVAAKKTFKKLKGMSYNKKKNTLTLKNVKAPKYTLYAEGMGTGFKILLKGKNQLAGIVSYAADKRNSKGYYTGKCHPGSVTITGKGSLVLNKNKYHSNAISISGSRTNSTLTIARTARVQMYAYGTGDIISISGTTAKKAGKAVNIKGKTSEALQRRSVKVPGYVGYKSDYVYILDNSTTTAQTIYTYNGKPYYVDSASSDDYELRQVARIGSTNYYARLDNWVYVNTLPTSKSSGRVATDYGSSMTLLNKGAFYGKPSANSVSYFDTKTRKHYNTKWDVYKKAGTANGETYVTLVKKGVANKKDVPKGYKGVVETKYGATYSYAVKNGKLTTAK